MCQDERDKLLLLSSSNSFTLNIRPYRPLLLAGYLCSIQCPYGAEVLSGQPILVCLWVGVLNSVCRLLARLCFSNNAQHLDVSINMNIIEKETLHINLEITSRIHWTNASKNYIYKISYQSNSESEKIRGWLRRIETVDSTPSWWGLEYFCIVLRKRYTVK